MVAQYGPAVLAQPPKHGFSLLVYIVPPVVVVGGIALLAVHRSALATADGGQARRGPADGRARAHRQESERVDRELERL